MILQIGPDAPWWMHAAANTALVLHIGGGSVGLISGATALATRKGGKLHRAAGNVFWIAMMCMAGVGALVAPLLPDRIAATAGVTTFCLVVSAWTTVRQRGAPQTFEFRRFDYGVTLVALAGSAAAFTFGVMAANSPRGLLNGEPSYAGYLIGTIGAIGVLSDLKVMLRRGVAGAQRIARHVWRMCTALFVAAASFFLGQPQFFPERARESGLTAVPVLAVIVLMLFWMLRVRLSKKWRGPAVLAQQVA